MERKNKKELTVIVIASIFILILSLVTFLVTIKSNSLPTRELTIVFQVGEKTGVNLDRTDILDFGMISPGDSSIGRMVSIYNPYDSSMKILVSFNGNAKNFLIAPSEELIGSGEAKNVSIWLSVPKNTSFGNYSGTIIFQLKPLKG